MNYSQKHPQWKDVPLGTSYTTIGGYGCLLCSLASYIAESDITIRDGQIVDPGVLNRWLALNNGYAQGNLLIFNAVERIGLRLADYITCANKPAPMSELAAALDRGAGVLIEVDFQAGGALNQHWVRLLKLYDDEALIVDPWLPPEYEIRWLMASEYGHPKGKPPWSDPARAIYRAAIYEPAFANELLNVPSFAPRGEFVQEDLGAACP